MLMKTSMMRIIRSINEFFDFTDLWSVVLFTADEILCNQYQKDLRSPCVGCKWNYMGLLSFQPRSTSVFEITSIMSHRIFSGPHEFSIEGWVWSFCLSSGNGSERQYLQ